MLSSKFDLLNINGFTYSISDPWNYTVTSLFEKLVEMLVQNNLLSRSKRQQYFLFALEKRKSQMLHKRFEQHTVHNNYR